MSRVALGSSVIVPVVVAWTAVGLAFLLVSACARIVGWARPVTGALLILCALGNTSFLGIGVVGGVLGDAGLGSAVAYDQLGSFLALSVYGAIVAGAHEEGSINLRALVARVVRFAPFVALVVSPIVAFVHPSAVAYDILDIPAATVAPVAMFGLGLRFPRRLAVDMPVIVGLVVKLVAIPLVLYVVAALLGTLEDMPWKTSILQSAMPPMVTAGIVAVGAGFDEELVASIVGVGTLACVVTLPLWSAVLV